MVRIVLYGSKKSILQEEALAIFATGVNNQIRLEPEWISREENEFADYLSRVFDYDDWMLNPAVFQVLEVMWGPIGSPMCITDSLRGSTHSIEPRDRSS